MHKFIAIIILLAAGSSHAQVFSGNVVDRDNKALVGVIARWANSTAGTVTNESGYFRLDRRPENKALILSYIGFQTDTVIVPDELFYEVYYMDEGVTLGAIEIEASRNSNTFSRLNPLNIETLEKKEFKKAACCSLSESFQTSNAVDLSYTNAASGSKEIQFLGLRGLYTQFLIENRPAFSGILSNMGYDLIPGTWLDQVNIQKGASSAIYGAQSMAGAINVQLKKPHEDYPVYANLFADQHGRMEANLHLNQVWNERRASGLYLNGTFHQANKDHNDDSFQDDAKVNRFNGMFRNTFFGDRFEGQLNGQALFEKRKAGQINAENPYRIDQEISHFSLYGNLGYVDFEKEGQTAGSLYDLSRSTVNSSYGNQSYNATENRALVQMFYMHPFKDGQHMINTGPVFTASRAEEIYRQDTLDYTEWTAGVFLDYTFRNSTALDNAFTFTISQRLENVSGDEWMYVPRANIRYLFAKDWTLRGSVGRGFRFPRIYADQSALFATAKTWSVTHDQQLEKSWNTGINIVGKPYLWGKELNINTDAYFTWFDEQLVVDLDEDYGQVMIYPLSGKSRAFQTITTLSYPVVRYFNLKIGGKYTDTKTEYKSGFRQALMIPKWRGLASLDFESANKKWLWNLTSNFVGKMRLSDKDQVPHELIHEHDGYSKTYVLLQSQLTFSHKEWEFYVGAENLLDKTQHEAIIDAANPYGAYFNAAEIYAPVSGIKPYAGIKWYLKTRS